MICIKRILTVLVLSALFLFSCASPTPQNPFETQSFFRARFVSNGEEYRVEVLKEGEEVTVVPSAPAGYSIVISKDGSYCRFSEMEFETPRALSLFSPIWEMAQGINTVYDTGKLIHSTGCELILEDNK